ncbi:MAG: alpha/beta hydrolase [Spirochaetes bacterium]|nr:alpha/beta hydrolase [Spirochaetota bacterium]
MESKQKAAKFWLCIAIVGLAVSMIGASLVQTGGGRVSMRQIVFETNFGHMSGWLFVPPGVSAESPAPAVIVSHGMFNNRAMQDLNFVELSRRGFVVFAIDMFSHGDSAQVAATPMILQSMNEAVLMISRLSYVDATRIGISGHSLGGMSSNIAVTIDNQRETRLISAVMLNSANAIWAVEGEFVNIYGNRHVGIVAPQYEEFFMLDVDAAGNITAPRYFMNFNNAQSFLHFGRNPAGLAQRTAETIYREMIDGQEAIRVIYNPAILHPWAHFSSQATYGTIEFFQTALGAPNPIAPASQVWQWKVVFNTIGLVAIFIFLVSFVTLMVFTKAFEPLRAKEIVQPLQTDKNGKIWFFAFMLIAATFATLSYFPILSATEAFRHSTESFRQTQNFGIGVWALVNGGFGLLLMAVYYFAHGKKTGFSLEGRGIAISLKNLGRTLLLAALSLTVFFGILFFADFFFMVDFRIWVLALRPFQSATLLYALVPYMLFMVIFFVANSLSATSFNYNNIGCKKLNMLIFSLINVLPAAILLSIQYFHFLGTGFLFFGDHAAGAQAPYHMFAVWLFPFLAILSITPVIARKIYAITNNPYLPGIINGAIVTMMAAANTLTWS